MHGQIVVPPVESVIVDCFRLHYEDDKQSTCADASAQDASECSLEAIKHMSMVIIGLGMVTTLQ